MLLQVSTKLKVGVMWDHNGTYMEGYGFQYRDHGIIVELDDKDEVTGGPHSTPSGSPTQQTSIMQLELQANSPYALTKRAVPSMQRCVVRVCTFDRLAHKPHALSIVHFELTSQILTLTSRSHQR